METQNAHGPNTMTPTQLVQKVVEVLRLLELVLSLNGHVFGWGVGVGAGRTEITSVGMQAANTGTFTMALV